MSIINKMLQDLDTRNGRPGGEAMAGDAIRSIKPASRWRLGRNTLLAIVGAMMASVAGAWWLQQRDGGIESSRVVVPAPPVPVLLANNPPPATSQVPPALPVPEAAIADTAAPATAAVPMPVQQQVPAPVSAAADTVLVATALPRVAALAPSPTASASASIISPDNVETPPPPKIAAASPRAAGGKTYSPEQVATNLLGEAVKLDQQGHQEEAMVPLQRLLAANPLNVRGRQMLAQLQLDTGHVEQARLLMAEGQRLLPEQSNFTLALARLQVESGDIGGAIHLLEADRSSARDEPQLHAFLAALLLRVERYDEAVQHYLVALRSDPANASWLVGVGVALEGVGKHADAAEAYRRAEGSANLTPEIANFLSERLARLRR